MMTLDLAVPYKLKPSQIAEIKAKMDEAQMNGHPGKDYHDYCRDISETFILEAANQMYPDGMSRKDVRIFRGIKELLDNETHAIEVEPVQMAFICDLFLSRAAEEKVRFRPAAAGWYGQWIDHLERVKDAAGERSPHPHPARQGP